MMQLNQILNRKDETVFIVRWDGEIKRVRHTFESEARNIIRKSYANVMQGLLQERCAVINIKRQSVNNTTYEPFLEISITVSPILLGDDGEPVASVVGFLKLLEITAGKDLPWSVVVRNGSQVRSYRGNNSNFLRLFFSKFREKAVQPHRY